MAEPEYALDESGLLVPPRFTGGGGGAVASPAPPEPQASVSPGSATPPPAFGMPPRRAVTAPASLPPAGRRNWMFGVLGIVTGLASFVWPLVCLTVLVSLALSAVGASRANRLRHRGATGRGLAIVGVVIGLASAANLVFGISQMLELGSSVGKLLP